MKIATAFGRVLALLALAALPSAALAQTSAGSLAGRVVDSSGSALPGASVTATAPERGFTRTVTTESDGAYRFAGLPAGTYDVTVKLIGFKTVEKRGVVVNVATAHALDVSLDVAQVEEAVTVTAEVPVVQSEPAIGAVVSEKELENLPLNGRQFANLGILAPGTSLDYNSDPTKPGQLTIALNGGIGRNVNYIVDGGDNTDDTIGGALQNYSVENVQEFKIQTQQYKAEFGRSTGGVLTVVTKTGTNTFHGSGFGFFRDDSLNATTESEKLAGVEKAPYRRWQYGGSLGGPIVKDRVHFFGSYEKTKRDNNYTVDTGGLVPSEDGQTIPIPFNDELAGGKVTANLTARQFLQVRFGYQKNTDKYGASPQATPDSLGTITNKYRSLLVGHTTQVGNGSLNEFSFQYSRFENLISADSKNAYIAYPSGVHQGQNPNTPQDTFQTKYQFRDDFSFSRTIGSRRHDFKVGVNFVHEPSLGGSADFGVDSPQFLLLEDRVGSPVAEITQNGGSSLFSTPVNQYSGYVQDDFHVSRRVVVNVGLRYDYWTGFDLDQRTNPIWQALSTQTQFNEGYLQDFQGGKGGVLENDKNNWGPRIGFSWDVKGDGRQFVRGGWGIYYDFPYTNATILFPSIAVGTNFGVVYQNRDPSGIKNPDGSFFQPGQPLPPNQLPGLASNPPNEVASPTLATPFSRQGSVGYSVEVKPWLGLSLDLVTIDYRDIPFRFRINTLTASGQPRFPEFGNFRLWYGKGVADYDGGNLGVRARVSNTLTLQGFYTLSRTRGNVLSGADEFRLSNLNYQPDLRVGRDVSVDPLDPLCAACIGPLNTDARHRVTLGATWSLPHEFLLAGLLRYRSALPYLVYAGRDLNGDGFVVDLPPGVNEVNAGRGHSFTQLDLRASKTFRFGKSVGLEVLAEVFNVFDSTNPAGFVGNQAAGNFGAATTYAGDPLQGEQRLAQLGLRLRF
jgi:Carboxypeptidase regulatory-like domain/TonB dependent receptor-like, beta-barrel